MTTFTRKKKVTEIELATKIYINSGTCAKFNTLYTKIARMYGDDSFTRARVLDILSYITYASPIDFVTYYSNSERIAWLAKFDVRRSWCNAALGELIRETSGFSFMQILEQAMKLEFMQIYEDIKPFLKEMLNDLNDVSEDELP